MTTAEQFEEFDFENVIYCPECGARIVIDIGGLDPVSKLSRDVRNAAATLTPNQARYLVTSYYGLQKARVALGNQLKSLVKDEKPHETVAHFTHEMLRLEKQMVPILDLWSDRHEVGVWSKEQLGIGPILAAGLLAHIDIEKAPTVGHIWRFAGLDPTSKWERGQKRPWNADLKVICWKIGDSFVKVSGREDAFYGQLYRERKAYELERDVANGNAETAERTLKEKNFTKKEVKAVYESGHLPAGRLDLRARRWAVKMFLSHWHEVAYVERYGVLPPKPFAIEHLGHIHERVAPDLPEKVMELRRKAGR